MKKMETIEEYESRRREEIQKAAQEASSTGILCPKCKVIEMCNLAPNVILAVIPPRIKIECVACGFKTTVLK